MVWGWVENPYWQVFTGETYLQTEPPIDPSSLTRWRHRLESGGGGTAVGDRRRGASQRRIAETSTQSVILADTPIHTAIVDRGYQGAEVEGVRILRSGQRRAITWALHAMIKRRSVIEPAVGHMKADGKLGRNWLKGALGDAIHAVLCGADG